jgi:hypothetical protein
MIMFMRAAAQSCGEGYGLLSGEPEDDGVFVGLTRIQLDGGKTGMIGGIGVVLGLHAKAVAEIVLFASLAPNGAVEEIAGIELQARFGGEHLQDTAAGGLSHAGQDGEVSDPLVKDPVVIVALSEAELFVVLLNARTNGSGLTEVKGRILDGRQLTRGDESAVDGSIALGRHHDDVIENVARTLAGEVKIGMLG